MSCFRKPARWAFAHWTILTLKWYEYSCNFLKIAWACIKHNTSCCIKQIWSKLYCLHEIPFDFIHIFPLRPGVFLSSWSNFLERGKFFNIESKNWFSIHLSSCSWPPLRGLSWAKCPLQQLKYTKLNLFVLLICRYTIAYIPWFCDQNILRYCGNLDIFCTDCC